jgi:hypothetical protein
MLESLPKSVQDRAVEHLREYLNEISDEIRWDAKFDSPSEDLIASARSARESLRAGQTEPLEHDRL